MKTAILLSLLFATTTALAGNQKFRGTVETYTLSGNIGQATIIIKGAAAKKLFDDMNLDLVDSIDAGENGGVRTIMKVGENISCYLSIPQKGKNTYECYIEIEDQSKGKVGRAAVG